MSNGGKYYVKVVDANKQSKLSLTDGGSDIDLTSQGAGVGHSLNCKIDGTNDSFRLRVDGVELNTKIGKTAQTSQLYSQ